MHVLLETLTEQVLDGTVEPYPGSVVASIVGVRLRLLEYERKVKEQDDLMTRLEAVEEAASRTNGEVRRWRG
ncbi:MAG: hypothetical protein LC751_10915 [Actinobacteria bacterium]|nr:hypothetical protein [Actinomycetota bacterium]MCA1738757.1 hypothetical protein [Actinomycetota bacterium]